MDRYEVEKTYFDSEGVKCAGKFYLPDNAYEKLPCIVLANGFSGTMDWILPDFAKRFAEAGYAAFIFDYRHLGASGGMPRLTISLKDQRQDLKNALRLVRNDMRIDKQKIVLWGTSLGGSHIVEVSSQDNEIAAIIGNMPGLDVFKGANTGVKAKAANASTWEIIKAGTMLISAAVYDVFRSVLRLSPYYIKIYGEKGKAVFTDPAITRRFEKVEKESPTWVNKITARSLFNLPRYTEGTIEKINAPIFIALARNDIELDPKFIKEKFSKHPNTEIKEYPYDHFSMYHGEAFEEVVADQINFLKKHV